MCAPAEISAKIVILMSENRWFAPTNARNYGENNYEQASHHVLYY